MYFTFSLINVASYCASTYIYRSKIVYWYLCVFYAPLVHILTVFNVGLLFRSCVADQWYILCKRAIKGNAMYNWPSEFYWNTMSQVYWQTVKRPTITTVCIKIAGVMIRWTAAIMSRWTTIIMSKIKEIRFTRYNNSWSGDYIFCR